MSWVRKAIQYMAPVWNTFTCSWQALSKFVNSTDLYWIIWSVLVYSGAENRNSNCSAGGRAIPTHLIDIVHSWLHSCYTLLASETKDKWNSAQIGTLILIHTGHHRFMRRFTFHVCVVCIIWYTGKDTSNERCKFLILKVLLQCHSQSIIWAKKLTY